MKIKIVLVCFTLLMSLYSCNKKIDSGDDNVVNDTVTKYIDLALNDTIEFNKRIKYNDKAYSLIDLDKNDTTARRQMNQICYAYCLFNKNEKLKLAAEKLKSSSIKYGDTESLADAYRNLGLYYMSTSNNEKAIDYFFKAKKIFLSINKIDKVLKTMGNISITQSYACDFLGSNKTAIEMLSLAKETNAKIHEFFCYVKIGNNLSLLNDNFEAIKYFQKAEKLECSTSKKYSLNNDIASSLINMKKYNEAMTYIKKNLDDKKISYINPTNYSLSLSLYSYIQLKKNNFTNLKKKLDTAEKLFLHFNSGFGRNYNQSYLSMYYEKINDSIKAIEHAKKAVAISKSYKNPTDVLLCMQQLIKVDKKNASANAIEYIRINDSLQIAERKFRDKFARIAYETDEIIQQKNKAIRQKWNIAGLASLLILIGVLFFIINYLQTKQKRMLLLQDQQKANEQIYDLMLNQKEKEDEVREQEKKRIALELHDGIMNKLASTRMNLSVLSHKSDQETIDRCINYVHEIYKVEQEIRSVSHELHKEVLHKEDSFIKLLEDLIKEQKVNKTNYELELDSEINWNNISSKVKMNLYRIIQEACNNINKHAQANRATITFTIDEPNIYLSITDDGIGLGNKRTPKGIGIQNMKLRVKSLRGKINFSSGNYSGTTINISVPLRKKIKSIMVVGKNNTKRST
ncbi:tetratricopeptide repeat-containing sensor histidine kinase [Flavobacterium silvisoli]|nr:sensor histidine kinase [Flavobacterium silvisoli]